MILCAAYNSIYSKNKRHRPENDQCILETKAWMNHDREVGIPIFCVHCNSQETPDLIATTFQFVVGTESLSAVCTDCYRKDGCR